jgi:hypothetical protein
MMRFTQYLIEETQELILILEGKGQHQLVKQYGDKILKKMDTEGYHRYGYDHYNQKGDPEVPSPWEYDSQHGTPEHKTEYIMKHLGIPESPSYLDISKPDHAKTWNSHVNWMLKAYATGNEGGGTVNDGEEGGINRIEDIKYRALPVLKRFSKLVSEGKMKHESLAKFNHLTDLESAVNNKDPLNVNAIDPSEYTKIGENEHWHVVTPHTSEAACSMGHGTKWCTTSGAFEHYNEEGPLYIAIPKNPQGKYGKKEKYQVHLESNQFMNSEDEPVSYQEKDSFKHRPFPTEFSVIHKIHQKTKISDFTPEETEHLIKHYPDAAYSRLPNLHWTTEEKVNFLKRGSKLEPQNKENIVKTTNFDTDTITHILKHTTDDYGGKVEGEQYAPEISKLIVRKHFNELTPEHIDLATKHQSAMVRTEISHHPNITRDQLTALHMDYFPHVQQASLLHPKTTQADIVKYIDIGSTAEDARALRMSHVISHPNFPKDLHHEIMSQPLEDYNKSAELPQHQRIDYDAMQLRGIASPHTTKRHLDNIVDKMAMSGMVDLNAPKFGQPRPAWVPEWKNEVPKVRHERELHDAIVAHPLSTADHLMALIKSAKPSGSKINGQTRLHIDQTGMLKHPQLTPEIFTELVKRQPKNTNVNQYTNYTPSRTEIENHPMFTPEHKEMLDKVYEDRDIDERYAMKGSIQSLWAKPS